jgi:hypothetical protein
MSSLLSPDNTITPDYYADTINDFFQSSGSGVPGFSGFGHALGAAAGSSSTAAPTSETSSSAVPGFSGFGHALK